MPWDDMDSLVNAINDVIRRALGSVGVSSILEPGGLTRDDGKRPDGMSLIHWTNGLPLVWVATCVAGCHVASGAKRGGSAAAAAEVYNKRKG